ncbi:hypothetical protein GALMADRAFT_924742 [Galerina marginata CBS 339.88]|uniref:Uncharacterized protein n=1 Tax=Galerina marginata (strain CBS 339.88) TaxID=685588 RepID=A0A067SGR6_GALM3|nr:hypothetical protein GALMADRAFT_924742 [Galerina marginata CBS 339.88]
MANSLSDDKKPPVNPDIVIEDYRLGFWNVKVGTTRNFFYGRHLEEIKAAYPLFRRLFQDVYSLSPRLFMFFLLCRIWSGVEDAILMHLSSSLLRMVEFGILTGKVDTFSILWATMQRLLCSVLVAYLAWHGDVTLSTLQSKVTCHFDVHLIKGDSMGPICSLSRCLPSMPRLARLRIDLPTSQEAGSTQEVNSTEAWEALEQIIDFLTDVLTASSQMVLIANLSRMTGGPVFAFLCVCKPIISTIFSRRLWNKACFAYVDNDNHRRLKALEALSSGGYRQDIIGGNLSGWIVNEYEKTYKNIGDFVDDHPFTSFSRRQSPAFDVLTKVLGDLPMTYCAISVILNPTEFSVASIAILQQSSITLRYSLEAIFRSSEKFRRSISAIRKVYSASEVLNTMQNGNLPYPRLDEKAEWNGQKGMSFQLKSVILPSTLFFWTKKRHQLKGSILRLPWESKGR